MTDEHNENENWNPDLIIDNIEIEFYNIMGELVEHKILHEDINEINVVNFPSGIYHYVIRKTNQFLTSGRIIKI